MMELLQSWENTFVGWFFFIWITLVVILAVGVVLRFVVALYKKVVS